MAKTKVANLTQDALVEALMPDPSAPPPGVIMVRGFLGKSTDSDMWRLYVSGTLDRYIDIPKDKILHMMRLAEDRGTLVWVPKDLTLTVNMVQQDQIQAGFLDGSIADGQMAANAMNPFLMAPMQPMAAISTILPSGRPCYQSYMGVGCGPSTSLLPK